MSAVSLSELQQQIAHREQELQSLREQLQSKQSHFAELTRRKENLQSELRQIEEEIAALATTQEGLTEQPVPAASDVPSTPPPPVRAESKPLLGELLVSLLREAKEAMTSRQLYEAAQQRGYQSSSRNPLKSIENRLQDLKSQGIVRRAPGQYGFLLASSANGVKKPQNATSQPAQTKSQKTPTKPAKSEPTAPRTSEKGSPSAEGAKSAEPGHRGGQPPLRVVLTDILKRSRKPLSGSELAERALMEGYQTKSANFVNTVWTALGQMDNVERLPQQGYRLKKQ